MFIRKLDLYLKEKVTVYCGACNAIDNNKNPTTNSWEWWISNRTEQPSVYINKEMLSLACMRITRNLEDLNGK